MAQAGPSDGGPERLPLLDFVPAVTPRYRAPHHLADVARKLEAFKEKPFEFVFSVPPRHGKSDLVLHWIVWALLRNPGLRVAYVTYNHTQARRQAQKCRRVAREAGLALLSRSEIEWQTAAGGCVDWQGIQGTLTGRGYDVIIVDDPVKNRAEAESPTMRERAWAFYQNDCVTRLEPGSSFLCIQTRWHADDLAGRLTTADPDEDWEGLEYINIPAIENEDVEGAEVALWPEQWPLEALKKRKRRVGAYAWASLYQGHPVPRGSTVFGPPVFYDVLPSAYQVGTGLDFAYSENTAADVSVAVVMLASKVAVSTPLNPAETVEDWYYVRKVVRRQVRAPAFRDELRLLNSEFGGEMRIYAAGTELGAADFMAADELYNGKVTRRGLPIHALNPNGDKFTRAIEFAAAWNSGRVLVPSPELIRKDPLEYDWVSDYLDVVLSFSGVKDARDDDVDASVAAYDLLAEGPVRYPSTKNQSTRRV